MRYFREKSVKPINLKCSTYSKKVIDYSSITLSAFLEGNNVQQKMTKAILFDDILASSVSGEKLVYGAKDKKISLHEAYKVAEAAIEFITFGTFYFNHYSDKEIKAINTYFENREKIEEIFEEGKESPSYTTMMNKFGIEEYQVEGFIAISNGMNMLRDNGEAYVPETDKEMFQEYCFELVWNRIATAKYYERNPERNKQIDTLKDFYTKDERTFKILVRDLIEAIYIKKEFDWVTYNDTTNFDKIKNALDQAIEKEVNK